MIDLKEVFIIGGGSSLRGFDFEKLRYEDTIAVNMAALDVPDPTYCITADSGIFRKINKGYFKGIDTTWVLVTNPNHATMKWIDGKFINHKTGFVYNLFSVNMVIRNSGTDGIGFSFKDFKTGYNSGFCGLQLAVLLGYKKIHLLGFDLLPEGSRCHYHEKYHGRKIDNQTFEKYYNNFVLALDIIKRQTDIQIISCSSISKLNSIIPYKPISNTLNKAINPPSELVGGSNPKTPITTLKTGVLGLVRRVGANKGIRFSILICSLDDRKLLLNRLLAKLMKQMKENVEIIINSDDGKISIGKKRNLLLADSKGDYIAFVDDDDLVSDDYISKILKALKSNPDCCGIEGEITFASRNKKNKFIHSIRYKHWYKKEGVYFRCPNHLSPVKRELALKVGFIDTNTGEDKAYSLSLLPFLKNEVFIDNTIYFYLTG